MNFKTYTMEVKNLVSAVILEGDMVKKNMEYPEINNILCMVKCNLEHPKINNIWEEIWSRECGIP